MNNVYIGETVKSSRYVYPWGAGRKSIRKPSGRAGRGNEARVYTILLIIITFLYQILDSMKHKGGPGAQPRLGVKGAKPLYRF